MSRKEAERRRRDIRLPIDLDNKIQEIARVRFKAPINHISKEIEVTETIITLIRAGVEYLDQYLVDKPHVEAQSVIEQVAELVIDKISPQLSDLADNNQLVLKRMQELEETIVYLSSLISDITDKSLVSPMSDITDTTARPQVPLVLEENNNSESNLDISVMVERNPLTDITDTEPTQNEEPNLSVIADITDIDLTTSESQEVESDITDIVVTENEECDSDLTTSESQGVESDITDIVVTENEEHDSVVTAVSDITDIYLTTSNESDNQELLIEIKSDSAQSNKERLNYYSDKSDITDKTYENSRAIIEIEVLQKGRVQADVMRWLNKNGYPTKTGKGGRWTPKKVSEEVKKLKLEKNAGRRRTL